MKVYDRWVALAAMGYNNSIKYFCFVKPAPITPAPLFFNGIYCHINILEFTPSIDL